jgi:hypothetical protein
MLLMVGNDVLPTSGYEILVGTLVIISGSIVIGTIIGQFSTILGEMSKKARNLNEEFDMITSIMTGLKVPNELQD